MLRSTTVITYELDDIKAGTDELVKNTFEKLALGSSSFGLLLCDSDLDHKKFASELSKKLGAPVVGFSSTAMFCGEEGLCDSVAILTTVTSDDTCFSIAASDPINPGNVKEQIEATYKRALASLKGEPVLVMAFPPYSLEITLDAYTHELSRVSGALPVFGGLPSHDEVHGSTAVYCGDTAAPDRLTVLLMSGNVKPVMAVKHSLGLLASLKRTVTKSEGNVISMVGDETFVKFLERFGVDVVKLANPDDKTISFTTYPLLLENGEGSDSDGVPVVRTLHGVNLETGTGTAIGEIPEGYTISVGVLQSLDIEKSARHSALDLMEKMKLNEADGYKYSMIFAVSCVGRYYVMASKNTIEVEVLRGVFPKELSMSGFYSFGELCPTSIREGHAINATHNESLVLLAI